MLRLRLMPSYARFYEQFDRAAAITVQAAEYFRAFLLDFREPDKASARIKDWEHEVDEVVHETMARLHRAFTTPMDRNDMRRLMEALDSILDFIHAGSSRLALYDIDRIRPEACGLSGVLVQATHAVQAAVGELRQVPGRNQIMQHCTEINRLENEGDAIYRQALADLFRPGTDPLTVIKWQEIFQDIETAIDHCEEMADVLQGIVLANG